MVCEKPIKILIEKYLCKSSHSLISQSRERAEMNAMYNLRSWIISSNCSPWENFEMQINWFFVWDFIRYYVNSSEKKTKNKTNECHAVCTGIARHSPILWHNISIMSWSKKVLIGFGLQWNPELYKYIEWLLEWEILWLLMLSIIADIIRHTVSQNMPSLWAQSYS